MGPTLVAVEFNQALLTELAGFDCGAEPWAQAASAWISNPLEFDGALKSIRDHGSTVWLFYLEDALVGFGSLGPWRYRTNDGKLETIGYIPQIAVGVSFQGEPTGAPH